jgi:hypothetical protein
MAVTTFVAGCSGPPDQRLADYAERATAQQAKQNEVAARQSEAMAQQSHKWLKRLASWSSKMQLPAENSFRHMNRPAPSYTRSG